MDKENAKIDNTIDSSAKTLENISGLEELRKDFADLKSHIDTNYPDEGLNELALAISNLLQKKEADTTREQFERYPELIRLMHGVVGQAKSGKDHYKEGFALSAEKKLLLELMYSVLATLGRQEQARIVVGYANAAGLFFQKLGLGGLYSFLEKKS